MEVIFYSTNCPRCNVLKKKLSSSGIEYTLVTDINEMKEKGFMSAPMLEVDGEIMDFKKAVEWVKGVGEK
ncbi:MAG: hypothetical protein IKO36_11805 [Bacteroidaceae bacterium]|nr:hypothetical protein [Bacteroidaceae bacterium]